jgi:hypothetical protein
LWQHLAHSIRTKQEETESENALVDAYSELLLALVIAFRNGDISEDQYLSEMTVLISEFGMAAFLSGKEAGIPDLTAQDWDFLNEQNAIHLESARNLAVYAADPDTTLGNLTDRLTLWVGAMMGILFTGVASRDDDPYLMWVRNPFKDSCTDCVRLDGQIHRASEWLASGWIPRTFGLECRGFNCGCVFVESDGPARGNF